MAGMQHHQHALRSAALGRLRYIVRRLVRSLLSFTVAILCISAVVNATMETTVRSQIVEMVQGAVMNNSELKNAEDIIAFKRETMLALERSFGLHLPSWRRVLRRSWDIMTLRLGNSRSTMTNYPERSRRVRDIVLERTPHTLILFTSSTLISIALGLWLGTRMAAKPGGKLDRAASLTTMIMYGTPSWWLGTFFILFFVYLIPIFRIGSLYSVEPPADAIGRFFDYLSYLILPLLTLVVIKLWSFAYLTRSMVVIPMQEDFVMAARGRGIPEAKILRRHGLRTAAPGVMTLAAQAFAQSIVGDILLERVMTRPGLGTTLFNALGWNDINLITGILAMVTAIYCLTYALLDIAYALLDPRIAYGRQ
jgi:peptide/nickel transport system permease protein